MLQPFPTAAPPFICPLSRLRERVGVRVPVQPMPLSRL